MKAQKVVTVLTVVILVAILAVASFVGVYKLKDYRVRNVIPEYKYGKQFSKSREVKLTLDDSTDSTTIYDKDGNEVVDIEDGVEYTEENGYIIVETKTNSEEDLTLDNYKKAKRIVAKRLRGLGVEEYSIKLDKETGEITVDLAENDETDETISVLTTKGVFQVVDSEDTSNVLIDAGNVKSVKVVYGQTQTATVVYLQIKFDKEGAKKLEEISKIYVETPAETTDENGEETTETESKDVSILLDGQAIRTTHFGDTLTNGTLNIPVGSGTDSNTLKNYVAAANELKVLIGSGIMPVAYTQTNELKDNSINIFDNKVIVYSSIAVIVLAGLFLIVSLKLKGIFAIISNIGYISLLLLTLRYTNVLINVGGLIGIGISIILNYIYVYLAFKKSDERFIKEVTKKFAIRIIPAYVVAIVFTFINIANISSIGMALVWGLIIMYLYNIILTQPLTKE